VILLHLILSDFAKMLNFCELDRRKSFGVFEGVYMDVFWRGVNLWNINE
jgi:hypothetical protein